VTKAPAPESSTPALPQPAWKEEDRLKAVEAYDILDTPREQDFDDLAKMASQMLGMPVSLVSFMLADRQWFKAEVGLGGLTETPRDVSICQHAILQPGVFVVPDTTKDPRFQDNPLVTGEPHLRFYAGARLETAEGLPLGTMCVLDYKPRAFSAEQAFILRTIARQVMTQLDLRRALRDKHKSEERLSLALDASGIVGTWDWDIPTDRVLADPRFVLLFGTQAQAADGMPIAEYIKAVHPADLARVKEAMTRAMKTGEPFHEEYRLVQKDGTVRWIDARGRCRFDETGKPARFPGAAVDITDRKASEQAAREADGRFHLMAESMAQKIYTASPTGGIDYLNQQWAEFSGVPLEQLAGRGWLEITHPDDREEAVRRWNESIEQGHPFEFELRQRRRDGGYRWHLSRAHPIRDAEGKIVRWIGSSTDIDDQRRSREELERMVEERTDNLKASVAELEAFSYSISHDMRAPLRAMLGFSEILQEEYGPQLDEQANRFLQRIRAASVRMDSLIQDVLSFSRLSRGELPLEPIEPLTLMRELIESYPNLRTSEIGILLPHEMPQVLANQAALTQCISNLLGNAVKFVAPGVKPVVRVRADAAGGRVKIWFKDNGIGIREDDFQRIFEIFQRVDRSYEGTGIGLAIVKKAAERMGGTVGVASTPGHGASFWLDLRAA
jgi:PAS domain S-box-containing protein